MVKTYRSTLQQQPVTQESNDRLSSNRAYTFMNALPRIYRTVPTSKAFHCSDVLFLLLDF